MTEQPVRDDTVSRAPAAGRPDASYGVLARRTLTVTAVVAVVVLLLLLIGYAVHVVLLAFAGVLIAVLLRGLSGRLTAWTRLPAGWSLAVVVILLVGLIALTSWLIAPGVARQSDQIAASFPRAVSEYQRTLEQYDWGRYLIEQSKNMRPEQLAEGGDGRGGVAGLLWSSVNFGVDFIVVVFVGLFLAVNPRRYLEGALRLIPEGRRPRGREVLHDMGHWMGRWLLGRFISMVVIGTATGVGLWLLGVPLAATLGLLTGLLDFIPTFGPILAAIPTALVALTVGPMMAVYALALYTAIGCFDGYVVTPLVQMRVSELPPALLLIAQVLMGLLAGGLGLVLAAPLLVAVMVLVQRVYVEDVLQKAGRKIEVRPGGPDYADGRLASGSS